MADSAGSVVVAIPAVDDFIWEASSEKIPHITLLFLGDNLEHQSEVEGFIKHVAQTSLPKFVLYKHHRGTLGKHSADVLFFEEQKGLETLRNARSHLLTNSDIYNAYSSTEQFPSWIPHLTLGYPETPAKPDAVHYSTGYNSILFDRIALWSGDYKGVEFELNDNSGSVELAMATARGSAFLEHYGVKGMKWGVRRDKPTGPESVSVVAKPGRRVKAAGGRRQPASDDAIQAAVLKRRAKKSSVDSLSNKELQQLITRLNMEQQYSRLKGSGPLERGSKALKQLIGVGRTANEARSVGETLLRDIRK